MGLNEQRLVTQIHDDDDIMRELGEQPSAVDRARVDQAFAEAEMLDNPPEQASHGDSYSKRWRKLHERRMRSQMVQAENDEGLR